MIQGSIDLVAKAQDGDEESLTMLMRIVREHHMPRYTNRYRGSNVLVGDDEIESEFLLGVYKALSNARLDVGNPINFICWKGQKAVQSLFRKAIRSEVRYQCLECGDEDFIGWKQKVPACKKCASQDLWTWMVTGSENTDPDITSSVMNKVEGIDAETAWQLAVYGIEIEEMRDRLQGRARELFELIVFEGINRDSSRNYLQEIADRWGVSTTAVAIALRKLRRDILEYVEA